MKTPNEQQRRVIDALDKNLIVFASAGTGKTFTVAARIANILTKKRATAEEILCLTFTIKACNEMKEDIVGYCGDRANGVQVNTIHGFCYRLLETESKRQPTVRTGYSICDEVDQEELLRNILSNRLAYWRLEEDLNRNGLPIPDLDACPLCFIEGSEEIFWQADGYFISTEGNILFDDGTRTLLPLSLHCPNCKEETVFESGRCERCGKELTLRLPEANFEIFNKKSALRNLASAVKHIREEKGFYSEDSEADYLRAFHYLQTERTTVYEGLLSYRTGRSVEEELIEGLSRFVGRWLKEYDEQLRVSNALDFDDLILGANAVLQTEEGLAFWSKKYKYIILDEMQDTSLLEYEVLKKLFADNNVMLCGDIFQTIYGWRGSRPEQILTEYQKEFSAVAFTFSENYRATKILAEATFGYLRNTYPQLLGKYCPDSLDIRSEQEGEKITCYAFDNRRQEAWGIYKYLLRIDEEKRADVCIIARSNKYIAELARYFEQFYIESEGKDGLRFFTVEENIQFFKKPLVKDILAVFKLLVNPSDCVAMERLSKKYVRTVGIKTLETLRQYGRLGLSVTSFLDENAYRYGDSYAPLLEGYQKGEIVVYDTETTGLDLEKDEIIQLSAIKIGRSGEILDTLDILIEPTLSISEEAYKTHGFTLDYIRANGGVTAKEGLKRFFDFACGNVLVGHNNLAYDKPLLERQLKENGLPPLKAVAEYDTLRIAKQFYPTLSNYKLSTLCEKFSVVNECAHNALGDITATGKCLAKMIEDSVLPTAMERRTLFAKYADRFEKFYAFIREVRRLVTNGQEFIDYVIDSLRLRNRYSTRNDYLTLQDIVESMRELGDRDRLSFLKEYLQDAALSGSQLDVLVKKSNKIPIITVHQAKGCEFSTVILAGADDGNFPSFAAKQSGEEEEEKKVFYVAISRAKERLILTRALHNGKYDLKETPYFWLLPEEYVLTNRAWKNAD